MSILLHPQGSAHAIDRTGRITLTLAVFASGAAALVFQILWFRQCGVLLGGSISSMSTVLAAFMIGLGLGNGLVTATGASSRDCLRLYAMAEAGVAAQGSWSPACCLRCRMS